MRLNITASTARAVISQTGPNALNGTLDDFRVYNRALSPSEVTSLYSLPGVTTIYANKYHEKNVTSGEVTSYYYLGDRLVALRKGTVLEYVHQEHLGGSFVSTDGSGAQKASIGYLPFGDRRNSSGVLGTDRLFTGERLDGTGLYFLNARYYDPSIGRFISPDSVVSSEPAPNGYRIVPLTVSFSEQEQIDTLTTLNRLGVKSTGLPSYTNPQELNRYTYALNNPLKYTDADGHQELTVAVVTVTLVAVGYYGYQVYIHNEDVGLGTLVTNFLGQITSQVSTLFGKAGEPTLGDSDKKVVDKVLEGANLTPPRSDRVKNYEKAGGKRSVTLDDGTEVTDYPKSTSTDKPTIEIKPKDDTQKRIKVRYGD